jgi:hypothetical protein
LALRLFDLSLKEMTAALRFLVELPGIEPGVDALMVTAATASAWT